MKIGETLIENGLFLAPMAGYTDSTFRRIAKRYGCGGLFTEMVSAKALIYQNDRTWDLLITHREEDPIGVQIFGSEPDIMGKAARILSQSGNFKWIDINMGCPAPKIVKNQEGCALMKNPDLAGKIISEVVKNSLIPVTIKIRKGWDSNTQNGIEIAKIAEERGVSAITVHGRTREQFYTGKADWDYIADVVSSVKIPVIGNGDVDTPQEAENIIKKTRCSGVMIGRGALGRPWIFRNIIDYRKTGITPNDPPLMEIKETILEHLSSEIKLRGEKIAIPQMRKHLAWYIKGFEGASVFRNRINNAKNFKEVYTVILEFFDLQMKEVFHCQRK